MDVAEEGARRIVVPEARFAGVGAEEIAAALRNAAETGGAVSLALAGGSTPRPVYEILAGIDELPWQAIHIFFGDERAVPPDHPESNYRMAREALLDRVPLAPERIHRIDAERDDRDEVARTYAALLPDRLDLLLLGIGADGHTASLFPGSPLLSENERRVAPARGPSSPRERLTFTPPVIRSARRTVVLVRGVEKAEAVARALEGRPEPEACPAILARGGTWILDEAAASKLPEEQT